MKAVEKVLDVLCIICTVVFFLAVMIMVLAQVFAVVTLNGGLAVSLVKTFAAPAGMISGVTTVIAIILAYLRGQMKAQ